MLIRVNSWLNIIKFSEFSEFSEFSVAKNQSKTLIPQNKYQIFQIFLTALLTSSYENHESRIEDFFRIKSAGSSNYRGTTFFASGNKKTNTKLVLSEACPFLIGAEIL